MKALRSLDIVLLFAVVAVLFGCGKVNKVRPLNEALDKNGQLTQKGLVVYNLPMTEVTVEIPVEIVIKDGKLAYAKTPSGEGGLDCRSGASGQSVTASATADIKSATVSLKPLADGNNQYVLDLRSPWFMGSDRKIVLTESGVLSSGSASANNKIIEFGVQLVTSIVGIGSRVLGARAFAMPSPSNPCTEIRKQVATAVKTSKSDEKLYEQKRLKLLFGENRAGMDSSYDIWKARMGEIDRKIAEFKAGASLDKVVKLTFKKQFSGNDVPQGETVLFWIDKESQKIVTPYAGAFSGEMLEKWVRVDAAGAGTPVALHIDRLPSDPSAVIEKLVTKPKGEQGLYYRMPAQADMYLTAGKEKSDVKSVQIAQWGPVLALPRNLGSIAGTLSFELFADTGGLKSVGAVSTAFDISQLEKLGKSGETLLDAIIASNDEIARLTETKTKLTLQQEIRDLRTSLQTGE